MVIIKLGIEKLILAKIILIIIAIVKNNPETTLIFVVVFCCSKVVPIANINVTERNKKLPALKSNLFSLL